MKDIDAIVRKARMMVQDAREREERLNRHLGGSSEGARGNLTVSLRWDELEALVLELERLVARR